MPPRDSGSAGWMNGGGQGKGRIAALDVGDSGESASTGWEHQRKAGLKVLSSFHPGEFTFELKKPQREPGLAGSVAPRATGVMGNVGCSEGGLVPYRFPLPKCASPKKTSSRGKTPRLPVLSRERHSWSCRDRCHGRAFVAQTPTGGDKNVSEVPK